MKNIIVSLFLIIICSASYAQDFNFEHFKDFKWRNIGPAGMSGRITSIDVNLQDKDHIIIGSASGGVWESKNGGISWKPIFDDQPTLSIGCVRFNQSNPDEIWVGTGEGNPRNSHNSGAGIYKSLDGGKSWSYMGLKETKLIHRIIIHRDDPNTVYVGALGSAWGPTEHRGLYKTSDGGASWEKLLYTSEQAGVADMVVDPSNPNKMLVAMWEFGRTPWGFNSGGKSSGLYITYDGGKNFKKLSSEEGMPEGDIGRIGIAFAPSKPEIVYALIEAEKNGLYKSEDGGENWQLVSSKNIGNRPFYYSEIYVDPKNENRIYNLWSYVSKSEDGGKTFSTIMDYGNNVHPDHHAFWIDPDDPNYLIDGNDGGLNISRDGARSWQFVQNLPVGQFYHIDIDNDFPYNVYGGMQDNGSWAGPGFVLKRGGIRNYDWQELYFGDGFDVAPLQSDSRYGYAMSQEGNLAYYDRVTGRTHFIQPQHPEGEKLRYNWNAALSLDPFSDCGLYYGSQYVHKSEDCGHSWQIISPDLTTNDSIKQNQSKSGGLTLDITGAENHTTILAIAPSPYDQNTIFASTDDGNLQVTRDGGKSWLNIKDRLPGLPEYCWIPQIQFSRINASEIFVVVNNYRMNDWSAYLYHSADNGESWTRIVDDSDVDGFVCSVIQDPKEEKLIFLGTDVGLYFSMDHGSSWIKWGEGLPHVQIRDMKIQEQHDDLVLGTFGRSIWILDDIKTLRALASQGMNLLDKDMHVFDCSPAYMTSSRSYDGIRFIAQGEFVGDNKSGGAVFSIWNKPKEKNDGEKVSDEEEEENQIKEKDQKEELKIMAINSEGDTVRTFKRKLKEGFNRVRWRPDMKGVNFPSKRESREKTEPGGMPIIPGDYKILFEYAEQKDSTVLTVQLDPREDADLFDPQAKYAAKKDFNKTVAAATDAFENLKEAKKSMGIYKKIIAVQEDSIKKQMNQLHKEIASEIDSLMHLYMLPEAKKTEYRDNSNTLNAKLSMGNRFLGTATGAPTANGQYAIRNAQEATISVLEAVNEFFEDDWKPYINALKELPLNIYNEFESVEIE